MRAVEIGAFGPPDGLRLVDRPRPALIQQVGATAASEKLRFLLDWAPLEPLSPELRELVASFEPPGALPDVPVNTIVLPETAVSLFGFSASSTSTWTSPRWWT